MATLRKLAVTIGLCATLAGCGATYRSHGYAPPDDQLAAIEVGRDTRDSVASAVGRPGTTGILDASGWYYVESRFEHFLWRQPQEIEREVVAISFAPDGRVSNVERFGLEQGRVVPLSRRVTDSNVQGVSFLRQLLGNLGNFDAGTFLGGDR